MTHNKVVKFHDKLSNFKKTWVFATNSNFIIPASLQPDSVNFCYLSQQNSVFEIFKVFDIGGY